MATARFGARRALWSVIAAVLMLVLAACGDNGSSGNTDDDGADGGEDTAQEPVPGVTDDQILLGAVFDQTGVSATFGKGYIEVTEVYFDKINAEGGIHGRKLAWVYENDEYDPGKAASGVRRLVEQDNIFAMLYASGSAPNNAMMPYLEEQGVPFLMITSSGSSTNPPMRCCFSTITPAELYGASMFAYTAEELDKQRIAVLYQDDDFGQAGLTGARDGAEAAGAEIVAEVPVERSAQEFSVHIQLLQQAQPDAVLMFTTVPLTAGPLKEAKAQGFETTWVSSVAAQNPATIDLAEGAAEGVYFAFVWPPAEENPDNPKQAEFQQMLIDAGVPFEQIGMQHMMPFVNVELAVEALRKAGPDLTREKFIEALESTENLPMSTTAPLTFKPYDADDQLSRLGNTAVGFSIVEDGRFVRLTEDWIDARQ